ncbi:hypothetical protein Y1Q_0011181 [Alligator mississippiensis]|uniref:Uncharacterized protein n=1 Tax=Alligator mississippiensis TaxID=8496 RepID=A0A151MRR9_ALLMI|nr:hypothetical protein Y1Q_0011181 [Alligator mississippiensis]
MRPAGGPERPQSRGPPGPPERERKVRGGGVALARRLAVAIRTELLRPEELGEECSDAPRAAERGCWVFFPR